MFDFFESSWLQRYLQNVTNVTILLFFSYQK